MTITLPSLPTIYQTPVFLHTYCYPEHMFFYHSSVDNLRVGTILKPRGRKYEKDWQHKRFYKILEKYRPEHMLAHKNAVFLCDNQNDLDNAGGETDWLFTVLPQGRIEKHDLNWSSEIEGLLHEEYVTEDDVAEIAKNYWNGVPHYSESLWEYLTTSAKVIAVEPY